MFVPEVDVGEYSFDVRRPSVEVKTQAATRLG